MLIDIFFDFQIHPQQKEAVWMFGLWQRLLPS